MTLIRWNSGTPSRDLWGIQDEMNRLFDSFLGRGIMRSNGTSLTPSIDIEETADEFVVRADLPGITPKDIKVNLVGDVLTIRGERKHLQADGDRSFQHIERSFGVFERSFRFGAPVKNNGVKARYQDGVLEVHVPKAEEAKVREVEVQVSS